MPENGVKWTPSGSSTERTKLGMRWTRGDEPEEPISENFDKMSGSASRYQSGLVRYIGGQTKMLRSGRVREKARIFAKKSEMTFSTLANGVVPGAEVERKFEMHDTTHALDSPRTDSRAMANDDRRPLGMI